jgi:hypothetical protein
LQSSIYLIGGIWNSIGRLLEESSRGWLEGVFERLVFGMRRGHWKTAIKKILVELLDRLGPTLE